MSSPDTLIDAAALGHRPLGSAELWVDPFEALDRHGVAVFRVPLKDAFEGAYTRPEGHPIAVINSLTDFVRQRFTAAHELGHHALYREGVSPETFTDVDLDVLPADVSDEAAADRFAVSFLMPSALVETVVTGWNEDRRRMAAVMAAFEVSRIAAARRCRALGLVQEEASRAFADDKRTRVADLYALVGATPRDRRSEMGVRRMDHRLVERVRLLSRSPFIDDPGRLLRLT